MGHWAIAIASMQRRGDRGDCKGMTAVVETWRYASWRCGPIDLVENRFGEYETHLTRSSG